MTVAFIPVRGGSKSIPLKNINLICGKPLVYWTVKAACECDRIDKVYVASDSEIIRATVEGFATGVEASLFEKLNVIDRSEESASDTASTESAMLEFSCKYDFDDIVLIQATSPMLTADDLEGGFRLYDEMGVDSVLSVVRQYRFLWERDINTKNVIPLNYDLFHRPRRQEFPGYLMENGAFYITSRERLIRYRNRMSGNIRAYEMMADTAYEIDEPSDWLIMESLMTKNGMLSYDNTKVPSIRMFLTDCDGCLTDGGMYYSETGDELKKFNTRDGMGFSLLKEKGIITGIITGENIAINQKRAEKLKLDILEQGCQDKWKMIISLAEKYQIAMKEICYVGDDLNDMDAVKNVGFGCTVKNGIPELKKIAKYIASAEGGHGAIREIIDFILK